MKTIVLFFFLAMTHQLIAQDTAAIVKATPVKPATDQQWSDARLKAEKLIKDTTFSDSIFSGFMLMIGPRLWDQLKTNQELADLKLSNMFLTVPTYDKKGKKSGITQAAGKLTQGKDQYKVFWKYAYSAFDLGHGTVSELNQRDKFFCWQYFARIEEPIIAIQTPKGRLMLQFSDSGLLFIESTGN